MNDRRILAFVVLPMLAACGWWMAGRPSGEPHNEVMFAHLLHVEDFGIPCDECHAITESTALGDGDYIPDHDYCADCHDIDTECEWCHTNPDDVRPPIRGQGLVVFSHQHHVTDEGVECGTCHTAVLTAAKDEVIPNPTMDTCLGCHNHERDYQQANCAPCHADMRLLPLEAVAELDHGSDWISLHGTMAMSTGAACLQCHTETSCTDCHSDVAPAAPANLYPDFPDRYLVHRGDFLHSHPIDARADADLCRRCHDTSFCQDCHTAAGLTPVSANPLLVHPPGWNHGQAARLQITECAACHDQGAQSNCVECHRVGGVGGNPHPSSWTDRYELEDTGDNPMCRICHGS